MYTEHMEIGHDAITWEGLEHEHEEKGADWYWALGVISVSLALTSILFGNILFAMIIMLAGGTLGMLAARPAERAEFILNAKGLQIDSVFYSYEQFTAFWIQDPEEHPVLLLDTTVLTNPYLVIPIPPEVVDGVYGLFSTHVTEVELQEPLTYKLFELLGF